jgi:hypothetical protein
LFRNPEEGQGSQRAVVPVMMMMMMMMMNINTGANLCSQFDFSFSFSDAPFRNLVSFFVRFEAFTAMTMKNAVLWDVKTCGATPPLQYQQIECFLSQ